MNPGGELNPFGFLVCAGLSDGGDVMAAVGTADHAIPPALQLAMASVILQAVHAAS